MKKWLKRLITHSYIWKTVSTVLLICLVPTVLLSYLFLQLSTHSMEEDIANYAGDTLSIIVSTINTQMRALEQLPLNLSSDERLREYLAMPYYPLEANEVSSNIRTHILTNNLIRNVLIKGKTHPYICSTEGIFRADASLLTPTIDDEPMGAYFTGEKPFLKYGKMSSIYDSAPAEVLIGHRTIYFPKTATREDMLIIIDFSKIQNLLQKTSDARGSTLRNAVMFDATGRMIAVVENRDELDLTGLFENWTFPLKDGAQTVEWDGQTYILSYAGNGQSYRFAAILPREQLMADVRGLQRLFVLAIIITVAVAVLSTGLLIRAYYNPLRELSTLARSVVETQVTASDDEIDQIKEIISHLNTRIRSLSAHIEDSREAMENHLVYELISAPLGDADAFLARCSSLGLSIREPYFTIVLAYPRGDEDTYASFLAGVKSVLGEGYGLLCATAYSEERACVLLLNASRMDEQTLRYDLTRLLDSLRAETGMNMTVGVGGWCEDLKEIGRSYIEARSAANYRLIFGERLIFFSEIKKTHEGAPANRNLNSFGNIYDSILYGDMPAVSSILKEVTAYIEEDNCSLLAAKCLGYELISAVLSALEELSSRQYLPQQAFDVLTIDQFVTFNELTASLRELSESALKFLSVRPSSKPIKDISAMVAYLQEHYAEPEFSAQNMAHYFGMSLSYFSQYFKNSTGKTVILYTTELRMEKARELLSDTNLTLREILQSVGYYSESSFIKKFRQFNGCTPGEYRDSHSGK